MSHINNFRHTLHTVGKHDVGGRDIVVAEAGIVNTLQALQHTGKNLCCRLFIQFPFPRYPVGKHISREIGGHHILAFPKRRI